MAMAKETFEYPLPLALDVGSVGLTDEQFYRLCRDNRDLRIELTSQGEIIIMPPTGSTTGWRNSEINYHLTDWSKKDGADKLHPADKLHGADKLHPRGLTFDSSTGFTLPNGARRSPDAAWIRRDRWDALTEDEQEGFAPLCPDFVLELRSSQDSLTTLQDKMVEYMENGAQLGWLIDPKNKHVYIYRPGQPVEHLDDPESVSGDPLLPGFVLNMKEIW